MDKDGKSPKKMPAQRALPNRFRCKVGGEWKALELFSTAQKSLIKRQLDSGKPVDAAHSGMTCIEHTAGSRTELTCEVCNIKKSIDEFSKSCRRNKVYHCMRCVAWIETQEPDVTPAPLETGHVSAEEAGNLVWTETFNHDADFFAHDIKPQAPITALESLGLGDLARRSDIDIQTVINKSMSSSASSTGSSISAPSSQLPPHLQRALNSSRAESSTSDKKQPSSQGSSSGRQLPPHMRDKFLSLTAYEPGDEGLSVQSDDLRSISTATTVREEKENAKISFNAWDPEGNRHRAFKSPTTVSGSTSSAVSESGASGWDNSDWDNSVPVTQPPPGPSGRSNGKWTNKSECRLTRTELRQSSKDVFFNAVAPTRRVDEQRRQNFCEPDDDDDIYDP